MLSLNPIKSEKIWGYENWIASVYQGMAQEEFVKLCTKDFPLLVKVIQANDTLSVQVHPNDSDAVLLEGAGFRGKTECWLVLDATPDATIVFGLKEKNYSKEELKNAIKENCLEKYLNIVKVKKGDFIFIPAGTVHAIGGGLRLLEVQQSCDLTYRLYDWGRPREVHIEKGLAVINESEKNKISSLENSFECEYFSLNKISVKEKFTFDAKDDFKLIFVLSGDGCAKSFETESGIEKFNLKLKDEIQLKKENLIVINKNEVVEFWGDLELIEICAK